MPGLEMKAEINADSVLKLMQNLGKQLGFAESLAINRTANLAREAEKAEIKSSIDRPTPRTENSVFIEYSDKSQPKRFAIVRINNKARDGVSPEKYLRGQIEGGTRGQKAAEIAAIQHTTFLQQGGKGSKYLVPGKDLALDKYGNISKQQWKAILKDLKSVSAEIKTGKKAKKKRDGFYFFSKTKPLILQRQGSTVKVVAVGVKSVRIAKRLKFYETVKAVWEKNIEAEWNKAVRETLLSAR